MKAKTMIELLSLSTNLFLISNDEKMMNKLSEMAKKGKEKLNDFLDDNSSGDEEHLMEKIIHKAAQAKEELEHKIAETVEKMYEKMNIAHTNQIKELEEKIETVKKELAIAESKIINLESQKK